MNKFYEIMTVIFAVLGILLVYASVGFIETDQYMLAFTLFVVGSGTMFISIICQEKQ